METWAVLSSRDLSQMLFGMWFLLLIEVEMLVGRPVCTVIFTRVTSVLTFAVHILEQETNCKSVILVPKTFFAFSLLSVQVPVTLPKCNSPPLLFGGVLLHTLLLCPGRGGVGNQFLPFYRNCFALRRATAEHSSRLNCLLASVT